MSASLRSASRPRWFRIGPGLLLAIVVSVLVWRLSPPDPRNTAGGPPRSERARVDGKEVAPFSAPDPSWLLDRRRTLDLTAPQIRKLSALRTRWDRDTRELRGELDRASAEFRQSMAAERDRGVTLPEIQERAAPVTELSRQLAAARRAWWGEAGAVLSTAQRRRAEREWAGRFAGK